MKDINLPEIKQHRKPDHPIHPLILNRWSPRAMTGEKISDEEIRCLFEAARWAPSSSNNQPWRFLYAKRETEYWDSFYELLVEFNKQWCLNAALLGIMISRTTFERNNKPSVTHALDTGAAWENICIEGTSRDLVVHGMEGFDYAKAKKMIPEGYEVHAMFAVGRKASRDILPPELQKREIPSSRKKIEEFAFEGKFRT